nr:MAG TPA_asm: hypothetical protein [Caudoviricetes sp.]
MHRVGRDFSASPVNSAISNAFPNLRKYLW